MPESKSSDLTTKDGKLIVLAGYLRFIYPPPGKGIVAEVISKYAPEYVDESDVPIYRIVDDHQ